MPYDVNSSPEAQKFLKIIGNSEKFKKKFGYSWNAKHHTELGRITKAASISPDPIGFLSKLAISYEPSYKVWKPNMKIGPGKAYDMPVPNVKLGPNATKHLPNTDQQAKAKALQDKIIAHNAEIARLNAAQEKAQKAYNKAKKEHEKLNAVFDEQTLKYFSYIEKNCSEYLTAVRTTGKILFRGQDDTTMPIFIGHPRENRKAKDSDPRAQALYDKYLTLMGFKALRSNSIFTSSDKYQARAYGDVFAIFPINGFQFTWSTEESDLVLHSVSDVTGDEDEEDVDELYYEYDEVMSDISSDLVEFIDYTAGNDAKGIRKTPVYKAFYKSLGKWGKLHHHYTTSKKIYTTLIEIINDYVAFCAKYPKFKNIGNVAYMEMKNYLKLAQQGLKKPEDKGDKVQAAKMIKHFGLKKDNLVAALKSGNEVCVLGDYIAVDYGDYEKQIKAYFLTKHPAKKPAPKKNIIKPVKMKAKPGGQAYAGGNIKKKLGGDLGGFKV